jgi:hypothetical protein
VGGNSHRGDQRFAWLKGRFMCRVLPRLVVRFAAFCVLLLLLLLVSPDVGHAQRPRQGAPPDLKLTIPAAQPKLREPVWGWGDGYVLVVSFCVENIGQQRSHATTLKLFHDSSSDPLLPLLAIASLDTGGKDLP